MTSVPPSSCPVLDSHLAYRTAGDPARPTALFLHGNPTSSFTWREILPHVAPVAHCVAPDLIGFGASGKPAIGYRFLDHVRYLEAFLAALHLERFFVVAQDWGTALAFHLAARRPDAILGLAFMEFIRPMASWDDFHPRPEVRALFQQFRTPGSGEQLVLEQNVFVERILPGSVVRGLSGAELAAYRRPFPDPASRRPILALPRELPIAGVPADMWELVSANDRALRASTYPKLLFSADPGVLTPPAVAAEYSTVLHNCRHVVLGEGRHYLQEDHPQRIGEEIARWIGALA
ncbi:haloalkane dehalogenase [Massilia arenosa]|uniref:Haloalkane dehalogenase n=1 Tax=Zemynaea arenosa TaxID=2561931 RepID=A0A4Y9S8E1_9BURK|nr:haloalkane dehalogenase [Massilia arenosa]TFW17872.1 haloalkane dehalogenase [Massilia arenosa]